MKVLVEFDYPTIEGMIYKGTMIKVEESDFNSKKHNEKVKGKDDMGKIVWVPKKLLKKIWFFKQRVIFIIENCFHIVKRMGSIIITMEKFIFLSNNQYPLYSLLIW